jgi:hypothetical protein
MKPTDKYWSDTEYQSQFISVSFSVHEEALLVAAVHTIPADPKLAFCIWVVAGRLDAHVKSWLILGPRRTIFFLVQIVLLKILNYFY